MKKQKAFVVTGGAGFIGSHLVDELIRRNYNIIIIDNLSSGYLSNISKLEKVQFIEDNVQNINIEGLGEIDGIFHLAAQTSVPVSINKFYSSSSNNLLSSLFVFDSASKFRIPVIYASSSAVYGNLPLGDDQNEKYDILSPYAQDKLTTEHYAKMCWDVYKTPSVGLRFFNVYGPRQDPMNPYSGVISIFIDRLLCNRPVTVNGGYQTRDFIFVKDVVNVMVKSMEHIIKNSFCEAFNVGTEISISIDNLLEIITGIMNVEPVIIRKQLLEGDPEQSSGHFEKLKKILSIDINEFVKLKNGLGSTIDFIKNNQKL